MQNQLILLYDSNTDRPRVKIWFKIREYSNERNEYVLLPYGGSPKITKDIILAANEALSCFYLYGGYAGENYMKNLTNFVKKLGDITDEALNKKRVDRPLFGDEPFRST